MERVYSYGHDIGKDGTEVLAEAFVDDEGVTHLTTVLLDATENAK